jgi:hypothetical protein
MSPHRFRLPDTQSHRRRLSETGSRQVENLPGLEANSDNLISCDAKIRGDSTASNNSWMTIVH